MELDDDEVGGESNEVGGDSNETETEKKARGEKLPFDIDLDLGLRSSDSDRGVQYAKSLSIRYFIDIDILQNSFINIDILSILIFSKKVSIFR